MSRLEIDLLHRYPDGFILDVAFNSDALVTSLFGPSGSGKTSILSAIGGFLRPQSRRVQIGTTVLFDSQQGICLPPEKRHIGFVFQDHLLFPHLSVRDNLKFGRRGIRNPKISLDRVVEILELGSRLDQKPRTLSGGEEQRVALGRAILSEPDLLLMDEPLRSLDEPLRYRILSYLEDLLQEWQIPTIYVSHSQVEVRRLAQWTVVLEAGKVVDQGPTAEVIEHPALLDRSGPLGPVNILRVTEIHKEEGNWRGRLGTQVLSLPPPSQPQTVGLVTFPVNVVGILVGEGELGSVRNRLSGVIRHIHNLTDRVVVGIDAGQMLWSEITPEACAELDLRVELPVQCSIKVRSMSWLS